MVILTNIALVIVHLVNIVRLVHADVRAVFIVAVQIALLEKHHRLVHGMYRNVAVVVKESIIVTGIV
jgi:hypothetical protein